MPVGTPDLFAPNARLVELRDGLRARGLSERLQGLSLHLGRIGDLCEDATNRQAVENLIMDGKWLIEWTAADYEVDEAYELAQLQRQLCRWQLNVDAGWSDSDERKSLSDQAREWSDRLLDLSNCLTTDDRLMAEDLCVPKRSS